MEKVLFKGFNHNREKKIVDAYKDVKTGFPILVTEGYLYEMNVQKGKKTTFSKTNKTYLSAVLLLPEGVFPYGFRASDYEEGKMIRFGYEVSCTKQFLSKLQNRKVGEIFTRTWTEEERSVQRKCEKMSKEEIQEICEGIEIVDEDHKPNWNIFDKKYIKKD